MAGLAGFDGRYGAHRRARTKEGGAKRLGSRLLARQDPEGTWAGGLSSDGGLYSPKWISTTYTMLMLRDFGLPANNRQARKACTLLFEGGLQRDGGINYGSRGRSETCITGMILSILCYFDYDDRLRILADHLLEQQMPDGGWNCQRPYGATHASVHTTSSVLEGSRLYELQRGANVRAVQAAQRRGREFLLVHLLFRFDRTSEIIKPVFTRFAFPHGGITTSSALSITSNASMRSGDQRLAEAIEIVRSGQREDGRWLLQHSYKGKTYFELERLGAPSRWNTLRALRILKWWDSGRGDLRILNCVEAAGKRPKQVPKVEGRVLNDSEKNYPPIES